MSIKLNNAKHGITRVKQDPEEYSNKTKSTNDAYFCAGNFDPDSIRPHNISEQLFKNEQVDLT